MNDHVHPALRQALNLFAHKSPKEYYAFSDDADYQAFHAFQLEQQEQDEQQQEQEQ